jgi:DnaJ-class molecular chaperone
MTEASDLQCPVCYGAGVFAYPYAPAPKQCKSCGGVGMIPEGSIARLIGAHGMCCDLAIQTVGACVCSFQFRCVKHGVKCHGTHD